MALSLSSSCWQCLAELSKLLYSSSWKVPTELSCPLLACTHFAVPLIINSTTSAHNAIQDTITQNPQPHVYHLISFFFFASALVVDLFSDSTKPYVRTGIQGRTLIKTHTHSTWQVSALFSPSRNPQNRCPEKQKGFSEFIPFCVYGIPHEVFSCSLWSLATQKIRDKKDWAIVNSVS